MNAWSVSLSGVDLSSRLGLPYMDGRCQMNFSAGHSAAAQCDDPVAPGLWLARPVPARIMPVFMARRRRVNLAEEEFPMTPMIDMVFLLLVFFMTVSTLARADRLPLELPEADESEVPDDLSDRGVVSIDRDGSVHVAAQPVTVDEMRRRIGESLGRDPDLRIQVRAHRETEYAVIRKVLKACAEAGAYEVIYATYQTR